MVKENRILGLIYEAIDVINEDMEDQLEKSPQTPLYGVDSKIDSLGLVNLVVAIEESVEEKLERIITIADEKALSQKNSPFKTVGTLADYVELLLKESFSGE